MAIRPLRLASGRQRWCRVFVRDFPDALHGAALANARAREFVATTTLEAPWAAFSGLVWAKQWCDGDGQCRREVKHATEQVDLEQCQRSERPERDARVSVSGRSSAAQRAIGANPNDWSGITRVMPGDRRDRPAAALADDVPARPWAAGAAAAIVASFLGG